MVCFNQQDGTCPYSHPTEMRENKGITDKGRCRYGDKCRRERCSFNHDEGNQKTEGNRNYPQNIPQVNMISVVEKENAPVQEEAIQKSVQDFIQEYEEGFKQSKGKEQEDVQSRDTGKGQPTANTEFLFATPCITCQDPGHCNRNCPQEAKIIAGLAIKDETYLDDLAQFVAGMPFQYNAEGKIIGMLGKKTNMVCAVTRAQENKGKGRKQEDNNEEGKRKRRKDGSKQEETKTSSPRNLTSTTTDNTEESTTTSSDEDMIVWDAKKPLQEQTFGKILRVVLTGGPNGGKTTAIQVIPALLTSDPDLRSPKVLAIPEMSTLIMNMGVNRLQELSISREKTLAFEEAIVTMQMAMEDTAMRLARKLATCCHNRSRDIIILMDRGIMDCKGYVPQHTWEAMLVNKNTTEQAILARYDAVIHVQSVAVENPELYDELRVSNPLRTENREQAAVQDEKEWHSWEKHHPAHVLIENEDETGLSSL